VAGDGVSRRRLLQICVASAASSLLAACGAGPAASASPVAATAAVTSAAPTATLVRTSSPQPTPTVSLLRSCAVAVDDPARPLLVDAHAHLDGQTTSGTDYPGAAETALGTFAAPGVRTGILMPMPFNTTERTFDVAELAPVVARCKQRLALGAGGGSLQPVIATTAAAAVSAAVRRSFEDTAAEIVKAGAVVFGEMAAHHLSFNVNHPYESIAADHPLFLLLGETAARSRIPIDLHLDAIARDVPTPPPFRQLSPNNPPQLRENIAAFERLLDHAKDATVV